MIPKGFLKFVVKRTVLLLISLVVAVYISILLANFGGLIDEMVKSDLLMSITMNVRNNPAFQGLTASEKQKIIDSMYQAALEARGLNTPFLIRSLYHLKNALTLDLGTALYLTSDSGSKQVRLIILERLPQTIMLFTSVTIINFFTTLLGGLLIARKYGSKIDRAI
ncbi:MAG: hypothetical protein QW796_07470 [Thermoproteota archaeon]